jgi:hypothetical protein
VAEGTSEDNSTHLEKQRSHFGQFLYDSDILYSCRRSSKLRQVSQTKFILDVTDLSHSDFKAILGNRPKPSLRVLRKRQLSPYLSQKHPSLSSLAGCNYKIISKIKKYESKLQKNNCPKRCHVLGQLKEEGGPFFQPLSIYSTCILDLRNRQYP